MLLVCCFCDHVREESTDHTDLRLHVTSRTAVSYTCCHACLQGDPGAITFRTRQNKSNTFVPTARARARRPIAA
jgi:hypothetical protein